VHVYMCSRNYRHSCTAAGTRLSESSIFSRQLSVHPVTSIQGLCGLIFVRVGRLAVEPSFRPQFAGMAALSEG
jgi:hypothetical protein